MLKERELVDVADGKTVWTVEIGNAAGSIDVALIIVGRIEGGIAGGSRVDVLGEGVCGLKIVSSPAPRKRGLQSVVDGICIVGEDLISAVAVQARRGRTRDGVGKCVVDDRCGDATRVCDRERMGGAGIYGLDRIARLTQMDASGSDIANFQDPELSEVALQREVPLLRVGDNEMPRNFEHK